jgi:branched-chain amino acid transport system ATP-binding protein
MIETIDVEAGYGRAASIVRGVSLLASAGAVTTIIGPNGAGKSTLLKALVGTVPLRSGDILLAGASIGRAPVVARVEAGIRLCGQGRANFPELTVGENMRLAGYSLPRRELRARLERIRAEDPITDQRWGDRIAQLSGGQQQAVEMSMSLVTAPTVLLLDEPSLGLSPAMRAQVFARTRAIADSGVCVLVVEQNVEDAAAISDRFVVLDQGRVALDGPPAAVLENEALRHVYVGSERKDDRARAAGSVVRPRSQSGTT